MKNLDQKLDSVWEICWLVWKGIATGIFVVLTVFLIYIVGIFIYQQTPFYHDPFESVDMAMPPTCEIKLSNNTLDFNEIVISSENSLYCGVAKGSCSWNHDKVLDICVKLIGESK